MRRFVLLAVACVLSLSACSGAGSVLSTGDRGKPDKVIITVIGASNIARVLPGASIPLSATAAIGPGNGTSTVNRFLWSAALVTSGSYVANTNGGTKPCNDVTVTSGGVTQPYGTDFSIDLTIDPTNEANVLFTAPPSIAAPAGATLAVNYPYCVVVTAKALSGSSTSAQVLATGSIVVAVVNPSAPEQ